MTNPEITLRLKADNSGAIKVLQESAGQIEKALDGAQGAGKRLGSELDRLGQTGKAALGLLATGVAAGSAALLAITRSAISSADALDEMSQRVGVSAQELSTLGYAAQRGGLDMGTFESAMVKLTKAASDTARGTGEARAGFEALGISVTSVDGSLKTSDQLLREVAAQFAGMEDGANKTALAVNLFGRAGAQMIPFLNQGAEGIAEVQQRARDLGLEITDTTAALAGGFNDSLDDLSSLVKGFGNDLATALLPGLSALAEVLVTNGIEGRKAATAGSEFAEAIRVVIGVGIAGVAQIQKLGAVMGAVAAQVDVFFSTIGSNFQAFKQYQDDVFEIGPVDAFVKFTKTGFDNVGSAIDRAGSNLEALNDTFDDIDNEAQRKIAALNTTLTQTAEAAGEPGGGKGAAPALASAAAEVKKVGEESRKAKAEVDPFRTSIDRLLDEIERAQVDQLAADMVQLQIALDEAIAQGDIDRANRLGDALENLSQQGVDGFERLEVAGVETFDYLEQAARDLEAIWLNAANSVGDALTTALFDGAEAGADAIKDVMEQLARDLIRFWIQQKIIVPLQTQLTGGAGGAGGLFGNAQLGQGLGGVAMGGLLGFGATGSIGGGLGGAAGSFLGNMFAPALASSVGGAFGAALGSALPIIGTIIGSLLGNAIGGLFSDDPKPRLRINSSGAGIGNIGTRGTTALGTLAFNADDLEDTRGTERQLLEAIQALDQGFVTLVNTFDLGQTQLDALRDAASRWSIDLRNSAITGEAVLGSRFGALLDTFDEHIVSFVGSAGTLEERMGRLTEALFIDAAAATGDLVDDFATLVDLLDQFGAEGEAVDVTYRRLLQSTQLMEEAFSMMGASIDQTRESFVAMAQEFVDAAGGFDAAAGLLSGYYNRFFSEQERAEMLVARAGDQAAAEFADIGLDLEDFLGPGGMQRFRDQFEALWPTLSAADRVEWLQAANALGFLNEALATLQQILDAAADSAAEATAAFRQLGNSTKPSAPPGLDIDIGGLNPGLPADPAGPADVVRGYEWMPRSIDVGATLGSDPTTGSGRSDLDLLLGNLSNLKDRDKLQLALEGLQTGDASAEDVLSIGRRLYGSGSDYNALFDQVRAMQAGAVDSANAERPIEREQVAELQAVRAELAEVKALLGMTVDNTSKTAEATGELAQGDRFKRLEVAASMPRSSRGVTT